MAEGATNDGDHLDGEIALEASLTETGIKTSARSRFLVALDRMFGGIIDIPTAVFEGKASQRRMEDALRRKAIEDRALLRLEGQIELDKLELSAAAAEKRIQTGRILNKAAVASAALEDLTGDKPVDDSSVEIDDDWLNIFDNYARNASSDRARDLWGRILSGEVRKPGSFSLITLRVLSELDQRTAETFQRLAHGVLEGQFLIRKGTSTGQALVDATYLEEAGLLQEASGMLNLNQTFNATGDLVVRNRTAALIMSGSPNSKFQVPIISITRAGQDILKILPSEDDEVALRAYAHHALPHCLSSGLVRIVDEVPGGFHHSLIETLKTSS